MPKKEAESSSNRSDFVIPEKSEIPEAISPQELSEAREAIKKEISEPPSSETEKAVGPSKTPSISPYPPADTPARLASQLEAGGRLPIPETKSPTRLQIETILEEDLKESFQKMDLATQIRFKQQGERTAQKIEQLLNQLKVKVKAILDLIRNWLRIIPSVNKFFIEQETKIKVDKIMALRKKE